MRRTVIFCLVIWIVGLVIYSTMASSESAFLLWDDKENIVDNPLIESINTQNLRVMASTSILEVYEPLAWLVKSLEVSLFGKSPRAFHFVSLFFHLISASLLFLVCRRLLRHLNILSAERAEFAALICAVVWMAHPLRAEVVAWASGQSYAQAGMLFLVSIYLYIRGLDNPERKHFWLMASVAVFIFAALSKTAAIILPVYLVLIDVFMQGPNFKLSKSLYHKQAYIIGALAVSVMAMLAGTSGGDTGQVLSFGDKLLRAVHQSVFYLSATVWPSGLAAHYAMPDELSLFNPKILLAAIAFIGASWLAYRLRKTYSWFWKIWVSYLLLLSPTIGFIQHGNLAMAADRYTYLTMFGVYLGLAVVVSTYIKKLDKKAWAWAAAVVVVLSVISVVQVQTWKNTETLWKQALTVDGGNSFAMNNLGFYYMTVNDFESARKALARGFSLSPDNLKLALNYGVTLEQLQRLEAAALTYLEALQYNPNSYALHNNLGVILAKRGDTKRAAEYFKKALELKPDFEMARKSLEKLSVAQPK